MAERKQKETKERDQELKKDKLDKKRDTRLYSLVEPVAKTKSPGLLLGLSIDNDHFRVLDLKDSRTESVMESSKPVGEGALDSQVCWYLGRSCISQSLVIKWDSSVSFVISVQKVSPMGESKKRSLEQLFVRVKKKIPCGMSPPRRQRGEE